MEELNPYNILGKMYDFSLLSTTTTITTNHIYLFCCWLNWNSSMFYTDCHRCFICALFIFLSRVWLLSSTGLSYIYLPFSIFIWSDSFISGNLWLSHHIRREKLEIHLDIPLSTFYPVNAEFEHTVFLNLVLYISINKCLRRKTAKIEAMILSFL